MNEQRATEENAEEGSQEEGRSVLSSGSWIAGAALIIIGILFLVENVGDVSVPLLENWWAIFLLLIGVGALGNAWREYRDYETLTAETRRSLVVGLLLLVVGSVSLFGLDWSLMWPFLLIVGGLGLLLTVLFRG